MLIVGIGVLTVGAALLVGSATSLAERLGVSRLVIGLTVVAFGTSMPEIAIGVGSAIVGDGSVALGNAVGSNVFNILFILGGVAVIRPVTVSRQLIRLDVPVMIAAAVFALLISLDGAFDRVDGAVMLALAVVYTSILMSWGQRIQKRLDAVAVASGARPPPRAPLKGGGVAKGVGALVLGLALLTLGSRLLLFGASDLARVLGMSELVIGLTGIAVGTSLPEMATSLWALKKGQQEIAVGNIIGSNIFNVVLVLGAAAVVASDGVAVPVGVRTFDLPVMIAVSVACFPIFFTGWTISRTEGVIFLGYYVAYVTYLVLYHSGHAAQDLVAASLLWFALPLTALIAGIGSWRQWRARGTS